MDYIEDDFTDAICEKSPSTWYTLIGEPRRRDNSQGS